MRLQTDWLQIWWCKKFNRPRKDPLLLEYTIEELFVEFLEELIEHDPNAAFPKDHEGVQYRTGDDLIDRWEKAIAEGRMSEINWDEDLDPEFLTRLRAFQQERNAAAGKPADEESDFSERYDTKD